MTNGVLRARSALGARSFVTALAQHSGTGRNGGRGRALNQTRGHGRCSFWARTIPAAPLFTAAQVPPSTGDGSRPPNNLRDGVAPCLPVPLGVGTDDPFLGTDDHRDVFFCQAG
jgi:hypothetical protein